MKESEERGAAGRHENLRTYELYYGTRHHYGTPVEPLLLQLGNVVHSFTVNFTHIHNRSSNNNNTCSFVTLTIKVIAYLSKNIKIVPKM